MTEEDKILQEVTGAEYKYGFTTDIESDKIPKGLNEDIVRLISAKKKRARMASWKKTKSVWNLAKNGRARLGKCKLWKA